MSLQYKTLDHIGMAPKTIWTAPEYQDQTNLGEYFVSHNTTTPPMEKSGSGATKLVGYISDPDVMRTTIAVISPPPADTRIGQSSLLDEAQRQELVGQYLGQTVVLLSIATVGALLLLAINLIGILFCKGYLKKRVPSASQPTIYLHSLSYSRRCRYSSLLRRFSLETSPTTLCECCHLDGTHSQGAPSSACETYCYHGDTVTQTSDSLQVEEPSLGGKISLQITTDVKSSGRKKRKCSCSIGKSRMGNQACFCKRSTSLDDSLWMHTGTGSSSTKTNMKASFNMN